MTTSRAAVSNEDGFGLVELLIAMVIMSIALFALMGVFSSSLSGVARAGRIGTAGAMADRQMEQYRAMPYTSIGVSGPGTTNSAYVADAACSTHAGGTPPCGEFAIAGPCYSAFTGAASPCTVLQNVTGPDGHSYRIDTYIVRNAPTATQRATKTVTVVVRDGVPATAPVLARVSSTFDCSSGGGLTFNPGSADC
jgi:prepilin-type N-terminal cleavage/methylation domain-containing protein